MEFQGEGGIDLFVANAGITSTVHLAASDADWSRLLEVNLLAQVRAARRLVPMWLDAGGGRLVLTASVATRVMERRLGPLAEPYPKTSRGCSAGPRRRSPPPVRRCSPPVGAGAGERLPAPG